MNKIGMDRKENMSRFLEYYLVVIQIHLLTIRRQLLQAILVAIHKIHALGIKGRAVDSCSESAVSVNMFTDRVVSHLKLLEKKKLNVARKIVGIFSPDLWMIFPQNAFTLQKDAQAYDQYKHDQTKPKLANVAHPAQWQEVGQFL
ncbi:hypothetical protein ACJX0J_011906 [Zea mays]